MIKKFLNKITSSTDDPKRMRRKQVILMGGVVIVGVGALYAMTSRPLEKLNEPVKEDKKESVRLETPFEAVNPKDIWVNRVQKEAEDAKSEVKSMREETQMMGKKLENLENILLKGGLMVGKQEAKSSSTPSPSPSDTFMPLSPGDGDPLLLPGKTLQGKKFSPPNLPAVMPSGGRAEGDGKGDDRLFEDKPASRIFHMSLSGNAGTLLKNVDNYVPAGSYARAVLTSGVVASTALQSSSQPQPIVMRLVDDGHLPRGFGSAMRDNVLIAACYGDLSSERVQCRLESMSWVEKDGVTVEKKVDGWIVGEDGRPGLRGEVVDRSGEAVRDTMIAGMLSGLSGFLKQEATSSVYPVSPFGQTNALKGKQALSGAATSGASNAMDKLAEFSIKRAEQMQPVILVASGRVVDVVFQKGVDIRPELAAPSLTLIDQKQNPDVEKERKNETAF
jgi:conjugal transfer pilus assembly protein TraB